MIAGIFRQRALYKFIQYDISFLSPIGMLEGSVQPRFSCRKIKFCLLQCLLVIKIEQFDISFQNPFLYLLITIPFQLFLKSRDRISVLRYMRSVNSKQPQYLSTDGSFLYSFTEIINITKSLISKISTRYLPSQKKYTIFYIKCSYCLRRQLL